jgi:hypothetical protein
MPGYNPPAGCLPVQRQAYDFAYSTRIADLLAYIVGALLADPHAYVGPKLHRYLPEV